MKKYLTKAYLKSFLQITLGVFIVSNAFYFFLSPCKLVCGGTMGISILLHESFGFSETISIYVLNILFLLLGLIFLGKSFFCKTVYGTLLSPSIMAIYELIGIDKNYIYNQINPHNQLLLVTICGAVLTGIGIGLVVRNGACTGGMDIPERILSVKLHLPFSYMMYLLDGTIILVGISIFGIERGIFAIIMIFLTGYLIDIFSVGGSSKRAFYIVTDYEDEIRLGIINEIDRGLTIIEAKGGYTYMDKKMIVCILNKGEYSKLKSLVYKIDPKAFIFITKANEVIGKGFSIEKK